MIYSWWECNLVSYSIGLGLGVGVCLVDWVFLLLFWFGVFFFEGEWFFGFWFCCFGFCVFGSVSTKLLAFFPQSRFSVRQLSRVIHDDSFYHQQQPLLAKFKWHLQLLSCGAFHQFWLLLLTSQPQAPTLAPTSPHTFYHSVNASLYLSLDIHSNFTYVSLFLLLSKALWTCYTIP